MPENGNQRVKNQGRIVPDRQALMDQGRDQILTALSRANEISDLMDSSSMVQEMLDLMIQLTRADSAKFFQLDQNTNELVITHVRGDAEGQFLIGLRLNYMPGLPGISLTDSRILVVDDYPTDLELLRTVDPITAARKKNLINLPVANKERTFGVVQLFNFQQSELDLLTLIGNRMAIELARRSELDKVRQSNQRMQTLVDILSDVAGTLDRNQLLHLVTENAARLVNAERSSLFLVDPNTGEMVFQVAYHSANQESPEPSPATSTGSSRSQGPNEHHQQSGRQPRPTNFKTGEFSYYNRSAITVPLRSEPLAHGHSDERGHILGGLMVLNNPNAAFQAEDAQLMQILANQASTLLEVADLYESAGELFLGVIKSLVAAIDAKDPYTQGHSQRVSDYSVLIAKEFGLDETLVNDIRIGSLLHDIGKIGIPDSILSKNGKLTDAEMGVMRGHPSTGVNIMSQVKFLDPMRPAILEHHERLDGSGYPFRLTDKQISLMGRIVAVADVFDAMTSNRPYRQSLSIADVLAYQREQAGILFDPDVVHALSCMIDRSN